MISTFGMCSHNTTSMSRCSYLLLLLLFYCGAVPRFLPGYRQHECSRLSKQHCSLLERTPSSHDIADLSAWVLAHAKLQN